MIMGMSGMGGMMMMGGMGGGIASLLSWLFLLALLIGGALILFRLFRNGSLALLGGETPQAILQRRFVQSEISADEFSTMKQQLAV